MAKRWLLGTHHGAVGKKHLGAYLDEFVFRFNRRTAKNLSHRFARVIEHAVQIQPTTYRALVTQPGQPDGRGWPVKTKQSKIVELIQEGGAPLGMTVLGFGQDADGELYVLANETGTPFGNAGVVLKLVPRKSD